MLPGFLVHWKCGRAKMGTENQIDELFDAAVRLERRGEWERAISLYEQAVDKWPNRPETAYAKNSVARLREMQKNTSPPPAQAQNESKRSMSLAHKAWSHRGIRVSIGGALALLVWDAAISGSFLMSFMVCPIWFLASILKSAVQRPGWRLALLRIAIPALTLGLVFANDAFQYRIGKANAPRIIAACEEFHSANGKYPKTLDELVPRYMGSIPRAKYCLMFGDFVYMNYGRPMLVWYVVPPYGRKVYDFEEQRWNYLD
jgi:tetratricopeptide (TPR) repeat protein